MVHASERDRTDVKAKRTAWSRMQRTMHAASLVDIKRLCDVQRKPNTALPHGKLRKFIIEGVKLRVGADEGNCKRAYCIVIITTRCNLFDVVTDFLCFVALIVIQCSFTARLKK